MIRKAIGSLVALSALAVAQDPVPTFKADVVSKSINAINYQVLGGSTKVNIIGTALMPGVKGEAKVESKQKYVSIEAELKGLGSPTQFGAEYLTYVLWAVSTEGRVANLGEAITDKNGNSKLNVTTDLQIFALIVTAEPYFAVRQPTDLIVAQNEIRKNTKGRIFTVDAKTELLKKGEYAKLGNPLGLTIDTKAQPLELYEARNAIHIAKSFKADQYADDTLKKAESSLQMASNALASKQEAKQVATFAREAVQFAEESRALSLVRQQEEAIAATKAKSAADSKARAEAEAARKAEEAARAQADQQRALAEQAKMQAELAAAKEAAKRAEAQAAEAQALAAREAANRDAERSRRAADEAKQQAAAAEQEKRELRKRLLDQFNAVLETTDTDRGLVVNIGDVLFDTGKYTLRQEAREKLARFAGIVLNYPALRLAMEGHTDSTGSDELNQRLSEQRAGAVSEFLATQGIAADRMTTKGYGPTMPVAENTTAAGRQKNRRVEIVVSGEVIGTKIGQ